MQRFTAHAARRRQAASVVLALLALTACQRPAGQGKPASAAPDAAGYLPPPTLVTALRDGADVVTLSGRAPAQMEVRLQAPSGAAFSATAGDDGGWSMQLPASSTTRMFAFEGDIAGRLLHSEGAVLVLPAPGPVAVLARTGYGVLPIQAGSSGGQLRIAAIDYDSLGGGSVSGVTAPRAPVRFLLDGKPVGVAQADDQGRFTILDLNARTPLRLGAHTFRIESKISSAGTMAVEDHLVVTPTINPGDAVFLTSREGRAWRTDWRTSGGGTQTSIVFDEASGGGVS